jgi:hypothetical protein
VHRIAALLHGARHKHASAPQAKLHKLDAYYHQRTEEDRLAPLRNLEERMAKFQAIIRTVTMQRHGANGMNVVQHLQQFVPDGRGGAV